MCESKKPLFLILKNEWYNLIASKKKTIEYRDFTDYWFGRIAGKNFSHALFQLGYSSNSPRMRVPIKEIDIGPNPRTKNDCFQIFLDVSKIEILR